MTAGIMQHPPENTVFIGILIQLNTPLFVFYLKDDTVLWCNIIKRIFWHRVFLWCSPHSSGWLSSVLVLQRTNYFSNYVTKKWPRTPDYPHFQKHHKPHFRANVKPKLSPLAMCPGNQWATSRPPKSKTVLNLSTWRSAWYSFMLFTQMYIHRPSFALREHLLWLNCMH